MEMGKETEMREKELYTKVCPECNKTFKTENDWVKRCHTCEKKEKIAPAPPKKKTKKATPTYDIPLGEFCRALDRYNDRHSTYYSYGQMSHAIDSGRISRKEFLKH